MNMKKNGFTLPEVFNVVFCLFLIIGQILCVVKFINSDFKPSYKRELIYGLTFVTGIGGVVGWFNIPDSVEVEK